MLAQKDAKEIADLFYSMDTQVREDLQIGEIANERDYVSRLLTLFNYPLRFKINNPTLKLNFSAKVNDSNKEKTFGCDSMIVFKANNQIKFGLFEAKWPRITIKPTYKWDTPQGSTKISHFTDQINRQTKWSKNTAIWEMFISEEKVGTHTPPYDKAASTCIKHEFALKFTKSNPKVQTTWSNIDLKDLIESEQGSASSGIKETNLQTIIFDILTCSYGTPHNISPNNKHFELKSNDGSQSVNCPIPSNDNEKIILDFMTENGITTLLQADISTSDVT